MSAPTIWIVSDGKVRGRGMQGVELSLADIAKALAGTPGMALPGNLAPGLFGKRRFPAGRARLHEWRRMSAKSKVDIATGKILLLRYVVVHDCGRMINPLIVEGQIAGAVAHGIGATLAGMDAIWRRRTAADREFCRLSVCLLPIRSRRSKFTTWNRHRR